MPHIFPRRFLRTRDILDPKGFNDDLHPVSDLLSGRLDKTNFDSGALKSNLRPHPDSSTPTSTGASVAEGAYFNVYSDSVESRYRFYSSGMAYRDPPNFVKLDGVTFRDTTISGSNPNAKPFVVPNHGGWTAVQNADLSASQQLNFTTGKSKVWISAYAQYIWQGFYEEKPPWIPAHQRFKGLTKQGLALPEVGQTFRNCTVEESPAGEPPATSDKENTLLRERAVLNRIGPRREYEYVSNAETEVSSDEIFTSECDYAFPLNEFGSATERRVPSMMGCHHISRGGWPCLVQFALRIDGKIIEETITGKNMPFEESAHGLSVTNSPRRRQDDEDDDEELTNLKSLIPGFTHKGLDFGQRSLSTSSAYGDSDRARPGQKVRSSRAVAYGPEVMPVRLGAVVDVAPGEHKIELVVRRLQRKNKKFGPGDFVGVFSRRLLAFDLPIKPPRQESNDVSVGSTLYSQSPSIPGFKTETKLKDKNVLKPREILADQVSSIRSRYIDDNVFSNEFLPSKVKYSHSTAIKPGFQNLDYTGAYRTAGAIVGTTAIFPGFKNTTKIDHVVSERTDGWPNVDNPNPSAADHNNNVGWYQLAVPPGVDSVTDLKITPDETVIRPNEKVILMMDVELLGIEPIYSPEALALRSIVDTVGEGGGEGGAGLARHYSAYFTNFMLAERYLDLFALFAIGYKQDDEWKIASESVPALVNSFNWINRTQGFNAGTDPVLPIILSQLNDRDIWDVDPRWQRFTGTGVDEFFSDPHDEVGDEMADWIDSLSFLDHLASGRDAPTSEYMFGRGGRAARSNLGVNIPIMQVISNDGTSNMNISEFAGFASSIAPDNITFGHHPENKRTYTDGGAIYKYRYGWASPVGGRQMLKGLRVHYGNSRLTAIKVVK